MVKLCVFDLDGTLIDSLQDIANCMNAALQKNGLPKHSLDSYRLFVGDGVKSLIRRSIKAEPACEELEQRIYQDYMHFYSTHLLDNTTVYDGILPMLETLEKSGIRLAVLTNKPQSFASVIMEAILNKPAFLSTVGQGMEFPKKPDPSALLSIIKKAGINRDECLYIGDSDVDIQTGKNANVIAGGALWGFRSREELEKAGADVLFHHPKDIVDYLDISFNAGRYAPCWE